MRVALNAHYLRRKLSGLGRYSRQVALALDACGFEVVGIVLPRVFYARSGKVWQLLRFAGLTLLEAIGPGILLLLRRCDRHVSPAFSAPLAASSDKSIVVVHDLAFIDYPHCYTRLEHWYFAVNLRLLKAGHHRIVVPSAYVKERLCSEHGFARERVRVISPYSDFERGVEPATKADSRYFLLLSNGHPRKNIEATIAGFQASSAPRLGFELLLVGNAERDLACADSVRILGGVSHDRLKELFEHAEAVLLFSFSEGFGYPVVEAASLGVPTLTSETSSLSEFLADPKAASPALTSVQIANRIDRFLTDESFRAAAHANIERVNRTYSRESFIRQWRELIYAE